MAHQVFQRFTGSFTEQRRPVTSLLAAIRRRPELSEEQQALRDAWNRLEEEVRNASADDEEGHTGPVSIYSVIMNL